MQSIRKYINNRIQLKAFKQACEDADAFHKATGKHAHVVINEDFSYSVVCNEDRKALNKIRNKSKFGKISYLQFCAMSLYIAK